MKSNEEAASMMPTATTPVAPTTPYTPAPGAPEASDALDREAAALFDTAVWQETLTRWAGPPPSPTPAREAPGPPDWRRLLSVPVDRLVTDALAAAGERTGAGAPAPPVLQPGEPGEPGERPLPGRLGAILPDRLHLWRRLGRPDVLPSVHLAYARRVLTEWGWQNTPYRLRDARGARCVCGAMVAAHRLGYGSAATLDEAGNWMLEELGCRGWNGLVGPWNRAPGRTAADALDLVDATIRRAARAGR
ncbi:hypothetical protein ACGFRB_03445 [Streptomyces sp. NPDC048718]|uniref:DUF6197 family protein n=1 Tax=Streptomyces sp. NPDC048718 TaxID=3365587 RepID=UPI00371161CD